MGPSTRHEEGKKEALTSDRTCPHRRGRKGKGTRSEKSRRPRVTEMTAASSACFRAALIGSHRFPNERSILPLCHDVPLTIAQIGSLPAAKMYV